MFQLPTNEDSFCCIASQPEVFLRLVLVCKSSKLFWLLVGILENKNIIINKIILY